MEYFPDHFSDGEINEGGTFNLDGELILFPAAYGRLIKDDFDVDIVLTDARNLKSSDVMFAEIYDYYKYGKSKGLLWRRKLLEAEIIWFDREKHRWFPLNNEPIDRIYHQDEMFFWPLKDNPLKDFGVPFRSYENGFITKHSATNVIIQPKVQ